MNQEDISRAKALSAEGLVSELYEFIKPFLEKDDPYALYFYSGFSLVEMNESDEEYDKRYVDLLTKAAAANVPEALYRLSTLYFAGDTVELNVEMGKCYLDRSLDLNFGPAKLTVGISLYYGSNGYPKNIEKAVELISDAEKLNIEGASEFLKKINA